MKVNNIFNSIAGEGIHTGKFATFLRLAGCSMGCDYCDTKFDEQFTMSASLNDARASVFNTLLNQTGFLIVTGGEPLEQVSSLGQFFTDLKQCQSSLNHFTTNLQTNGWGTDYGLFDYDFSKKFPDVQISVSPKYHKLKNIAHTDVYQRKIISLNPCELKLVGQEWLHDLPLTERFLSAIYREVRRPFPIIFQYCWDDLVSCNEEQIEIMQHFISMATTKLQDLRIKFPDVRVGFQIHKWIGFA